jgi:hypothetical protein
MNGAMDSQVSVRRRLTDILSRCEPAQFEPLCGHVISYSEVLASCVETMKSNKESTLALINDVMNAAGHLTKCINESLTKRLFIEYGDSFGRGDPGDDPSHLAQCLHAPNLQATFLMLLVTSSDAIFACSMLDEKSPTACLKAGWEMFVQAVRKFPLLAKLGVNRPCVQAREVCKTAKTPGGWFKHIGYGSIDLSSPTTAIEVDAWGAWIEASQKEGAGARALMEECRTKLSTAVNFLSFVATSRWPVSDFDNIVEGASMTAIVSELCRRGLRVLTEDERQVVLSLSPWLDSSGDGLGIITVGVIRKATFIVFLPKVTLLAEDNNLSTFQQWQQDPVAFTRQNWRIIPHSAYTRVLRLELEAVERTLFDARLEREFLKVMGEVTPEAFALLLLEWSHLPHETTLILSLLLRRAFEQLDIT